MKISIIVPMVAMMAFSSMHGDTLQASAKEEARLCTQKFLREKSIWDIVNHKRFINIDEYDNECFPPEIKALGITHTYEGRTGLIKIPYSGDGEYTNSGDWK